MAEIKNLFVKSKMNKDLDDRLIPSGEYRDAQNVMISRSEGADVGALENVLGNELVSSTVLPSTWFPPFGTIPDNISIIGIYIDENNDRIFTFLTNFIDNSSTGLNQPQIPTNPSIPDCFSAIACYDVQANQYKILTQGTYLNFSKNSIITGVNVLENLLFWTDNRNQPRKLNVIRALDDSTYYSTEDQISVAKYYPYNPARLWAIETCGGVDIPQPQMKNKSNPANPVNYGQDKYDSAGDPTNPNPTYDPSFTGDAAFLEDKFVRFSYRFKFEDDEFSLMAPFTQTAFIPKQDGYFILNLPDVYTTGDGIDSRQEDNVYKSTIVDFMENKVDSINIFIDLPCPADELATNFKVTSVEILYKEADSLAVKIAKRLKITDPLFDTTDEFINWEYTSVKPIKTLEENQTTRVFDRVPVRALAQEIVGNRVIYGNYVTSYPYPANIDYKVGISEKSTTNITNETYSRVEYPNHTLKQNRNYQVGIVLSDRFGRQTPVILTPPEVQEEIIGDITFKNSTIYHPYRPSGGEDILYWTGDSLKLLFNSTIGVIGAPLNNGLYDEVLNPLGWYSYKVVVKQQEQDYYNVYVPGILDGYLEYTPDSVINTIAHTALFSDNINKVPRDLKDVGPTQATFSSEVRLYGRVNNIATPYIASPTTTPYSVLTLNQPYNTQYYPGTSADEVVTIGTLSDMGLGQFKTIISSHTSIASTVNSATQDIFVKEYNTNIFDNCTVISTSTAANTIPVGALVKNYRENPDFVSDGTGLSTDGCQGMFNIEAQEYPFDIDAKAALTFTNATFYNSSSNPLIAQFATKDGLGSYTTPGPKQSLIVLPELAVLETTPTVSALDIYWETSTSGLITELNTEITSPLGPTDIGPEWRFIGNEGNTNADNLLSNDIYITNHLGAQIAGFIDVASSYTIVNDLTGNPTVQPGAFGPNGFFDLVPSGSTPYQQYQIRLKLNKYWTYIQTYAQAPWQGDITFVFNFIPSLSTGFPHTLLQASGTVGNVAPVLTIPAYADVPAMIPYDWPDVLEAVNGTANPNTDKEELILAIANQVDILQPFTQVSYFNFQQKIITGVIQDGEWTFHVAGGAPSGTYNITVKVTDADGLGITTVGTFTINLTEPGLSGSLSEGSVELPLWCGYYGYFASVNGGSTNELTSLSNASHVNWPNTYQSIPTIAESYQDVSSPYSPIGLGDWLKTNRGYADFRATYAQKDWPNFNNWDFTNPPSLGTDIGSQQPSEATEKGNIATGSKVIVPNTNYNTPGFNYTSPDANVTPGIFWENKGLWNNCGITSARASGAVGQQLGWGWESKGGGDAWESGNGPGNQNGNKFLKQGWKYTSNPPSFYSGKNKKWWSFWGSADCKQNDKSSYGRGKYACFHQYLMDPTYYYPVAGTAYISSFTFRTRLNHKAGVQGLTTGTALIRIVLDHWNYDANSNDAPIPANPTDPQWETNLLQDGVLIGNFLIQYRIDENSNWETALDINGNPLQTGIWDSSPDDDTYGYTSCLFYRGGFYGNQVRYNSWVPLRSSHPTNDNENPFPRSGGLVDPVTYNKQTGGGYVKRSDKDCGEGKYHTEASSYYLTKIGTTNNFPQGIALRNYTESSPEANQSYAEVCFAVNKVGDYRLVFDNIKQGTKRRSNTDPGTVQNSDTDDYSNGASPYLVSIQQSDGSIAGYNKMFGPGAKITVCDLYNERPNNRNWGIESPTTGTTAGTLAWPDPNKQSANYVWYAYTVSQTPQNTFKLAVDSTNWDGEHNVEYLFAKEPVFRYVTKFYTRVWDNTGGEWIYSEWKGTANDGWHAFTKQYVSEKDDTIPDTTFIQNSPFFPEDAGVPYGDERAYGPRRGGGNDHGLYATWAIQVQANVGNIGQAQPCSFLDNNTIMPNWYSTPEWDEGPDSQ